MKRANPRASAATTAGLFAAGLLAVVFLAAGCGPSRRAGLTESEAHAYLASRGFASTPEDFARAVGEDALDVVVAGLDAGIDPDALGGRALAIATGAAHLETLRVLLDAGADPNLAGGTFGQTPLVTAVMRGQEEAMELLLEAGADPNVPASSGAVALHFAQDPRTALALLDAGADVDRRDARGVTPLIAAVCLGDPDLVELLLERGADAGAVDHAGRSALLYAGVYRFSKIESHLAGAGAQTPVRPHLSLGTLDRYAGSYGPAGEPVYRILHERGRLVLVQTGEGGHFSAIDLVALTPTTFHRAGDPGLVLFRVELEGDRVTGLSRTTVSGWVTAPRLESES